MLANSRCIFILSNLSEVIQISKRTPKKTSLLRGAHNEHWHSNIGSQKVRLYCYNFVNIPSIILRPDKYNNTLPVLS